jgi:hypothetical protein
MIPSFLFSPLLVAVLASFPGGKAKPSPNNLYKVSCSSSGSLVLTGPAGPRVLIKEIENSVDVYWSPDSRRLAIVENANTEWATTWILDVESPNNRLEVRVPSKLEDRIAKLKPDHVSVTANSWWDNDKLLVAINTFSKVPSSRVTFGYTFVCPEQIQH